ncbi:Sodium channel protein 1 brain (Sodium channel protein I brain) [Durusdinium trenchii]|uniref:Sodium channel protein 1 brain (Sodium channel protein I brain) n=1 Tax=Durusdinium trenchii TaxID=1381693 RepID=A0ABP0JD94_9DINO
MTTFCKSSFFKFLCTLAIVANTVYLGIAADMSVKNSYLNVSGQVPGQLDRTPEYVFTVWFALEMVVKALGQGWDFFLGPSRQWNLFDVILVDSMLNLSFLRVFRVFRLVRVVRLVRTVRSLKSLRTMLFSIITSMTALFWAFVMLLLTMFMFSIIFCNGVAYYFQFMDPNNTRQVENSDLVFEFFGGVYLTLVSLFSAISGGNDWMFYGMMIRDGPGEIYFVVFLFYIFFCLVGLLNVVTGIFVDSAVCTRTEDEVVESFTEEQTRLCGEMKRIFTDADMDGNGFITFEEFCIQLENPWVQAFLSGLDIDITDARIVFTLLDVDGSGGLTVEEFVDGALKLKGPAKGIDMLSMMFDLVRYNIRFSDFCSFLEDQTNQIKEFVRPELVTSSSAPRFKTAQEELEGLSHITNRKVGREVVDGWGWANDHQGGGKSGYIYLFVSELPAPFK